MGELFGFVKKMFRGDDSERFEEQKDQPLVDPKDRRGIPEDIFIGLEQFICAEIGAKGLDGITYALILREKENLIQIYHALAEKVRAEYGEKNTLFREQAVCNGFIYIVHHEIVDIVTQAIRRRISETYQEGSLDAEICSFEEIRDANMRRLADEVLRQAKSGNEKFEVALYATTSSTKIEITGRGPNKEMLMIRYSAFYLLQEDLCEVNRRYLLPQNIRIARICQAEILPYRQGVSYILTVEKTLPNPGSKKPEDGKTNVRMTLNASKEQPDNSMLSGSEKEDDTDPAWKELCVRRVINATECKYHIICAGKGFSLPQDTEFDFIMNGKTYQVVTHKTTLGRIGRLTQCFHDNHICEGDEIELTYDALMGVIYAVIDR